MSGRENRVGTASALEQLEELRAPLTSDMPIAALERHEESWKHALSELLCSPLTGSQARAVAAFQRDVGLLPKYKSYAIKASSPLGYSVFLQRPGEGFSFQQHVTHKTEIFYILDVLQGGFVFLCDFEDWQRIYDGESFLAWMNGALDSRYERFRFVPQPGDVIVIEKLSVVHSVVGCVLAFEGAGRVAPGRTQLPAGRPGPERLVSL